MIHLEREGDVAVVRMAHGKVNALDIELLQAIRDEFEALEQTDCKAVVFTGSGSCFSAGVDLFRVTREEPGYLERFLPALSDAFRAVFQFPRPVIGAANGHAIAGGAVFLCCCDFRLLADTQCRVGVPELHVGVPFPSIALEILRFCVSGEHLQQLLYSGQTYLPADALRMGMVDACIAPECLMDKALEYARHYTSVPSATYALTKRQLQRPVMMATAAADALETEVNQLWASPSTLNAIRAYLDRLFGDSSLS